MALSSLVKKTDIYSVLALVFAALLQLQITLFSSDAYSGLRVNAADFLIPPLGIFILASLLLKKTNWPKWSPPFGYWCLFVISAVLAYGLVNGYLLMEEFSRWAFLNKFIGWFVLCAFIGAAGWISTNGQKAEILKSFYMSFLFTFCVLSFVALIHFFLYWEQSIELFGNAPFDFQAYMFNRNAYAFLFVAVLLFSIFISSRLDSAGRTERLLHLALWTMLPALAYFNGSRALWLCLFLVLPLIFIFYKTLRLKHVLICVIIGSTVAFTFFPNSLPNGLKAFHQSIMLFVSEENRIAVAQRLNTQNNYNHVRYQTLETGWKLIKENPIRGAGLGSIIKRQTDNNVEIVSVLDNTMLWVLVEMGPAGLLSFLIVYLAMLKSVIGGSFRDMSNEAKLGLSLMLFFGFFSMLHEIFYTRFFWFICAILMATSINRANSTEKQPR